MVSFLIKTKRNHLKPYHYYQHTSNKKDRQWRSFLFGHEGNRTDLNAICQWHIAATSANTGKQWERYQWQIKRSDQVAAVCVQRGRTGTKAHTGHRNRGDFNFCPSHARKNANRFPSPQFISYFCIEVSQILWYT